MDANRQELKDKKLKKIFIIVTIVCLFIVLIEGAMFFYLKNKHEAGMVYYDAYLMTVPDGAKTVAVGSSDFKKSKNYDYTDGIEKGKLATYDENGELLMEIQYDKGYASTFTSVLVVEDGYIVTGSGEYSEYQVENKLRDAFLIKYDKKGKKVWEKYYGVLSNTKFNKIIQVEDGYVVIGQSLYENMEVGNHTTGGGIIVKYDFEGNEIWHNNHGGNKSGNFNGIVEVDGDFYVVGKDAGDYGNIVKFNSDGEYVWHKNYAYTDSTGFQDIAYLNDKFYVVGSKKILEDEDAEERKTDNTDALIVVYDKKGKQKDEILFGGSLLDRFHAVKVLNNAFYLIGTTNSVDTDLDISLREVEENETITTGFIAKYDQELKLVDVKALGGNNHDVLTEMHLENNSLYVSGYSNSKDSNISITKNNGKDFFGKIILIDEDLSLEIVQ